MNSLRLALRSLLKTPGFAVFAILSLALGIGANTALFSVFDQIILKQLPVQQPERLVAFHSQGVNTGSFSSDNYETVFSYPMFADLSARLTADGSGFEALFARAGATVSVAGSGEPQIANAELVSGSFFPALGLQPAAGRLFSPDDDQTEGAHNVIVLGNGFWREHFGSRRDIVGQKLLINGRPMEVAGVAPHGFEGVVTSNKPEVYLTLHMKHVTTPTANNFPDRRSAWLNIFGRLRPGLAVPKAEAQAAPPYKAILNDELSTVGKQTDNFKRDFVAKKLEFRPSGQGLNVLRRRYESQLGFLMGMVGLILLIACANVANLLTVRAIGRRKEIAVRLSIGASRGTIIRQLLAESLLLSIVGGMLATALGYWLQLGLAKFVSSVQPGLDWRTLAFNFTLALVTTLLFGLLPAIQASNPDIATALKEEGGAVSATSGQGRLRQLLALAQVALALVLLTSAGLFARSLLNLQNVDLGFRAEHVLTFRLSPLLSGYTAERAQTLFREVQTRLEHIPGVDRAATVAALPLGGSNMVTNLTVEGYTAAPDENLDSHMNFVSPGYFEAMGIRRLAGREFELRDAEKAPKVAVVNEAFAKKWLRGANPLGKHFGFGAGSGTKVDIEIVGLVKDQKTDDMRTGAYEFIFIPTAQGGPQLGITFVVHSTGEENQIANSVRRTVHEIDANLPLRGLKSMTEQKTRAIGDDRLISMLTAVFGVLATMLAALGLYAVLSFTVVQRTKEIGIRMALGATENGVINLVLGAMLQIAAIGGLIGLLASWAVGRWAESLLFGLRGFDPLVVASAVVLMALVTLLAAALPSRRAARTDPVTALRAQ